MYNKPLKVDGKNSVIKGAECLALRQHMHQSDFIVYILRNESDIQDLIHNSNFFLQSYSVYSLPSYDCPPYGKISPSKGNISTRINTLIELLRGSNKKKIIFTSAKAIMQKIMPINVLKSNLKALKSGEVYDRKKFLIHLFEVGYNKTDLAENPGEYSVRGSIIDLIIDNSGFGYRLDFLGNELEVIKRFNCVTQLSVSKLEELVVPPISEIIINDSCIRSFKKNYLKRFAELDNGVINAIKEGRRYTGLECYSPLLYDDSLSTIFEYIPRNAVIIKQSALDNKFFEYWEEVSVQYDLREEFDKEEKFLSPGELYLSPDLINQYFQGIKQNLSSLLREDNEIYFNPINSLSIEAKLNQLTTYKYLKSYIQDKKKAKKVVITCKTTGSRDRLIHLLQNNGIEYKIIDSYEQLEKDTKNSLFLALANIERSFSCNEINYIAEKDILGDISSTNLKKERKSKKFLQEVNNIESGDIIVHTKYGIGRFNGLKTFNINDTIHDFLELIYLNDDKLYLPVENFELLNRYGENNGQIKLDKLGSESWQLRKAKLKKKIQIAADHLLKIAAERKVSRAPVFTCENDLYHKFCKSFPYVETEDQQQAIDDVFKDLSSGEPMDRLICGDVGFGKTEVALRSAFIVSTSIEKKQVAVLAPTTLLAKQHYKNFVERFKDFSVKIASLSRFVDRSKAKKIKEDLESGHIDIIIGTHALLSKNVKFKNLGLLIIDEEQHFGVAQKEKLKQLQSNTHVLTLSATPIPRTLHMSLSNIKSISIIATPPITRKPIKTIVMPFDEIILRKAILKELYRGGKVFYVTRRISYLDEIASKLKNMVPEVNFKKAHGQLAPSELENIMNDFYENKFTILLSTSIIESGLDVINANTLIVDNADKFGLAQLYQIRGRVGRRAELGYAYLTFNKKKKLSKEAEERLGVLESFNNLGAGFNIASLDMDIRGYGNLLGGEQSGNIKEIGIELYQKMLTDVVNKNQNNKSSAKLDEDWSPIINLGISAQIPESYIQDQNLRLNIYRKIAAITDLEEVDNYGAELADRFGDLPIETAYLLDIVKLKQIAKKANVEKLDVSSKGFIISFRNQEPANPDKIMQLLQSTQNISLIKDKRLLFKVIWKKITEKISKAENILSNLI